jgi:hypothetical protein
VTDDSSATEPGPAVRIVLIVVIALIAAIGATWIARRPSDGGWLQGTTAARDLPAYTTLDDGDVLFRRSAGGSPSPKGKVLLRHVKKGDPIPADALVTPAHAVAGSSALAVKVEPGFGPAPGEEVRVVGVTNGTTDVAFEYDGAVVLDRQADTVLLAMPHALASRAAAYLVGERRLIVLRRVQPP